MDTKKLSGIAYFIQQNAKAIDAAAKSGDRKTIIDALDGIELIVEHARRTALLEAA